MFPTIRPAEDLMASIIIPPQTRSEAPEARNPRRIFLRALWRAGRWGAAAAFALTAVAFITQTEAGKLRLQEAAAQAPGLRHVFLGSSFPARRTASAPAQPAAAAPAGNASNQAELRRLEQAVGNLTTDRDRLARRLASLEQRLSDMTGSIKAVTDATAATRATTDDTKQMKVVQPPTSPPPMVNFPPIISMVAAPPPQATAKFASPSKAPEAKSAKTLEEAAKTPTEAVASPKEAVAPKEKESAAQKPGAATTAPPKMVDVPLPPTHVASVAREPAPIAAPTRPEYGVNVAGAQNLSGLRVQWAAVKSNFGPMLVGLHPIASTRHSGRSRYRLVVGPLPNRAAAVGLCTRLTAAGSLCEPANFVGEPLTHR
jgi:SPOR domain